MDALIVSGNSIDDAIAQALETLNARENEVDVQVVDWGEPGVLGIGGRKAVVRVALREASQPAATSWVRGNWQTLRRGRIELGVDREATYAAVRNGQLIIRHPEKGPFPILVPCPGIEVRVNGKVIRAPQQVTDEDKISIKTCQEEIAGKWRIELIDDEVRAVIKLKPRVIRTYKLCDSPPSRVLRLRAEKEESFFSPVTFAELVEALQRLGIKQGVNWHLCRQIAEKAVSGEVVVAEGVPPTPSQDGYVELFCLTEPRYENSVDDSERVDFRERFTINSVVKGAVLARKHPPVLGSSGLSVKGEPVLPKQPADVILRLGRGVELHNETEIVAVEPGRPVIASKGHWVSVSIEPVLVHRGNVDLESGNLNFSGHIRILGDVLEGMLVNANEDVLVQGLVSAATVQAGGSIHVWGNVLSSTLVAGGPLAIVGRFLDVLDALVLELEKLVICVKQLRMHGAVVSTPQVIQLLLQHKCQAIPELVKEFQQRAGQLPSRLNTQALEEFAQQLVTKLRGNRGLELGQVESLLRKCQEWRSAIRDTSSAQGDVRVNSLLNSTVTATGSVKILGQCNDHSHVQAGGDVTVRGAFRGGGIRADGSVTVEELGAPVGTYTTVSVGAEGVVKVGRLHENVLITVGKRAYISHRQETDVYFYYDAKEDRVVKGYSTVR